MLAHDAMASPYELLGPLQDIAFLFWSRKLGLHEVHWFGNNRILLVAKETPSHYKRRRLTSLYFNPEGELFGVSGSDVLPCGSMLEEQVQIDLAENLNIKYEIKEIHSIYEGIKSSFKQGLEGLADENIQPRIRANILMAYSNSQNAILLATGNKSEIAVGYSTLYGDSCGAIAPIGDLFKTQVYELARYINRDKEIIPENIINKAPSAELRHDQKDSDSLPDYEILDKIIYHYV